MKKQKISKKKHDSEIIIAILGIIVISLIWFIVYDKYLLNPINKDSYKIKELINFDKNNCLNRDFSKKVELTRSDSISLTGIDLHIEDNNKDVLVKINYNLLADNNESGNKEYKIKFNNKVENVFGANFGNDNSEEQVYFFIMEDGSLEYVTFQDLFMSENVIPTKIKNVSGIVRLENVSWWENKTTNYSTIAYKIDDTYYDLESFIK